MSETAADRGSLEMPTGVVTFLLTDVAGSTRLWEAERDGMARAITRHYEIIGEIVAKHGGVRPVEQGEGDSTVSAFARASDAIRAALDIQRAMVAEDWPGGARINVRIGIHTGETQLRDDGCYIGVTITRSARLRSIGHGGQTLLSRTAADLVRDDLPADASLTDLGEHSLRDLARTERVYQLSHPDMPSDFPALVSSRPRSNNLPAHLTSFIGREQQMEDLIGLIGEARLLTLVGSGGCGKTRLAIEVAGGLADRYRDGVLWVDLSSLSEPVLVSSTIASALKIRETPMQDPTDTIAAYLEHRNLLVLLDNCEHLAAACADFAERILRACAEVTILATSREPLGVPGETAWRVPSLTLPSAQSGEAEAAESVRLFLDRARRSRPQFRTAGGTVGAIVSICRRLDGIPLAIELAAARIRTMSPQQIAEGIGDRFSLLGGGARTALPRQRTIEASVDWSYTLLSEPERIVFRRLGIFAGGFTLEAAERVCSDAEIDEFAVLELLSQLVDRSLVQAEETNGDTRYRLLETVRVFARQKLADSHDAAAMRDRHLDFFLTFVEHAEQGIETSAMVEWADRIERDHDNLRAAIDWSVESNQTDFALRLCAALFVFWLYRSHLPEGRRRVDTILALDGGDPGFRARALASAAGVATFLQTDIDSAQPFAEEALALARDLGDMQTVGRALTYLGFVALYSDPNAGRDFFEDAAAAAQESNDFFCLCTALSGLVIGETFLAEHDRARDVADRAVEVARATGHPFRQAQTLCWAGFRAANWGELETARRCLDESIAIAREIHDSFILSFALAFRGWLEVDSGRYEDASRDLEESMTIARPAGLLFIVATGDLISAERCYALGDLDRGAASAEEALAFFRLAGGLPFGISWSLAIQALIKEAQREADTARRLAEEALAVARAGGLPREAGRALLAISRLERAEGSIESAEENLHSALENFIRSHLTLEIVMTLEEIAAVACVNESFQEGARLLGAAQAAREHLVYPRPPIRRDEHETYNTALQRELGDSFDAAWAEGATLSLDDAVAYATRARGERKRPSHGWASLTPTELRIVALVCEGLTNPKIGERLFISKGTVRIHLQHIFRKLDVRTRAELAAEATRRDL